METKTIESPVSVSAETQPAEMPQLDTWELIRKPSADEPSESDEDDVNSRVLANTRPSVWDLD